MYRAQIEKVDGTRVRAGGKWLQCIGNKIFHVGDYVQTDGRCVYGNIAGSAAPIVVTSAKDDLVIPIQLNNSLWYLEKELQSLGEIPADSNSIVNNKKTIAFSSFQRSTSTSIKRRVLSANVDGEGNVFELIVLSTTRKPVEESEYHRVLEDVDTYVLITKNNDTLQTIETERDFVIWGFIEDANNWYYVAHSNFLRNTVSKELIDYFMQIAENDKADNESTGGGSYPLEVYFREVYANLINRYGGDYGAYTYSGTMTFFDSYGKKVDFIKFETKVSRPCSLTYHNGAIVGVVFNAEQIDYKTISYDGMEQIKFPMHDKFYFTMQEPLSLYRDASGFPTLVKKSIFTPNGKKIFSEYVDLAINFLACELKQNNYVVVTFIPPNERANIEWVAALTKQLSEYDYHPYGNGFWATFDKTLTLDEATLSKILKTAQSYVNSTTIIDTSGNTTKQNWQHLGYTLRKMNKKKLKQWFTKQSKRVD